MLKQNTALNSGRVATHLKAEPWSVACKETKRQAVAIQSDRPPVEGLRGESAALRVYVPVHLQRRADRVVEVRACGGAEVADSLCLWWLAPLLKEVIIVCVHVRQALVVDDPADLAPDDHLWVDRAGSSTCQTVRDTQLTFGPFVTETDERRTTGEHPVELVGVVHTDPVAVHEVVGVPIVAAHIIQAAEEACTDVRGRCRAHQRSCEPNVLGALEVAVRDLTLVLGAEVEVEIRLDETRGRVAVQGTYPGLQATHECRSEISWGLWLSILTKQNLSCRRR